MSSHASPLFSGDLAALISDAPPASGSAGKVLVVDDLDANARLLERVLLRDGHIVKLARDGQEALDLVAHDQPDVVLMELDSAESVLLSLALTIEARDTTTDGHCQRLAHDAVSLGTELGMGSEDLGALARGGFLHDIGKVGIPDAVLLKPSRLTPAEFSVMKGHTLIGDRLCGELRSLRCVRPIVRHHHERLDGTGYPDGLRGRAVPLVAQVIGVVDVFDALTTARPYRTPISPACACEELMRECELGWRDRELVDVFVNLSQNRGLPQVGGAAQAGLAVRRGAAS